MYEKEILELEKMRMRITEIYMLFGNPKGCAADMHLRDDIEDFKKKFE